MKLIDIALKDLIRSTRSMFLIGMALGVPLLLSGLIYFAFGSMSSGDVSMTAIKVGVVNADKLPAGGPLKASLGSNIHDVFFDPSVKSWIDAKDYPDEAAARAALNGQEIGVAVLIPQTFSVDYLAGKKASPITILQDPTLTIAPGVVREMITSLLDGFAGGGIAYKVIDVRLQAAGKTPGGAGLADAFQQYANWYADFQRAFFHTPARAALVASAPAVNGEAGNSLQTMMGLVLAGQMIFFSFFTGSYAMMSILQESEEGTLPRLFTTPTDRSTILAGKFLAVFVTVLFQGLVLMVAGRYLFGVEWGDPFSVTLSLLGQMFASVGLAVLLVSFIKTSKQAGPIFGGALTLLGMLSGLFTTNSQMPEAFTALGNFTPQGWVLKAWKLALAGQPAGELVLPFTVLIVMGVIMFVVGAVMFRKRYA